MAVRRRWRFWKRPGQRAEEKDIGTNPTGVKHRSPYSRPIPALSSTISSRNHRRIPVSPPLRLPISPSRFYSYATAFRRFSRKAHTCLMSPLPLRKLFPHAFCSSVGSHGNSFSLFLCAYLSARISSSSSFSILLIRLLIYP